MTSLKSHPETSTNNTSKEKIKSILNLLREGGAIKYESHKNVVLLLGNTGSGKSTFTQFIAGDNNNLISKEIGDDTGEFIIIDNNNRISGNSTITSQTVFPEMVQDFKTNNVFYDCPGFSDTRSLAHDITVTYFIKNIIDSAKAIKLVFLVSYPSVRQGVDRQDFMLLVKHATNMIKNIDKFGNSIALLVTKVDNETVRKKGGYMLVSDEKIINKIGDFLTLVKSELITKSKREDPLNDYQFYEKAIKFVDVLLTKNEGIYNKIGIFRRPDMAGVVSQIALLQDGKTKLSEIIFDNIHFITHSERDFGYTISAESKNYIHDLTNEINKAINLNVANIGKKIQNHYIAFENKFSDINYLHNLFEIGESILLKMTNTTKFLNPRDIINPLVEITNSLNIISAENLFEISNYDKYLKFIETINGKSNKNPQIWIQGFTDANEYVNNSKKWYLFLIQFFNTLSAYNVQLNTKKYDISNLSFTIAYSKLKITDDNKEIRIKDIDLQRLLQQLDPNHYRLNYNDLTGMILNVPKLNTLKKLIDETLTHTVEISYPSSNKMIIKGIYIKLGDIVAKISAPNIEFVEIFALYKVFIDASINKTDHKAKILIIAPIWQIVGNQKITLDGTPGTSYTSNAPSGSYAGSDGTNGEAGKPGGPAGHFIGIGESFIDGEHLSISAVGGKGGPGQNGGNGINGKNGEDPPFPDNGEQNIWRGRGFSFTIDEDLFVSEKFFLLFGYKSSRKITYTVYGTSGSRGGNGGGGGIGGYGGYAGTIRLIEFNNTSNIVTTALSGESGQPGVGGWPGNKGVNGKKMNVTYRRSWKDSEDDPCHKSYEGPAYTPYGEILNSGTTGSTGSSYSNRRNPEVVPFPIMSPTINRYYTYLRQSIVGNSVNGLFLKKFHSYLNVNQHVSNFYDTNGFINEFYDLENMSTETEESSLLPFYESLLQRIDKYSDTPKPSEQSNEYKKVLSYLYTAILSKIYSTNRNVDSNLKFNLYKDLDTALQRIVEIKSNILGGVHYYLDEQKEINTRISETRRFIDTQIVTEIQNIANKLDEQIDALLIDLIVENENAEDKNIIIIEGELEKNQQDLILKAEQKKKSMEQKLKLKQILISKTILNSLKPSQEFLRFLTSLASAINAAENVPANKSLLLNDFNKQKNVEIAAMLSSAQNIANNIEFRPKNNYILFLKQLNDTEQQLSNFIKDHPSDSLNEIHKQILNNLGKGAISDETSVHVIRKGLLNAIKRNKLLLEEVSEDDSLENQQKLLDLIKNILSIESISDTSYEKIRTNYPKINKLATIIQEATDVLDEINVYNNNLYTETSIENTQSNIATLIKNLQTMQSVNINIGEWNLQKTIKNINNKLQLLTNKFNLEAELRQYIQRLEQSITFVCNIYDNIENMNNLGKLAAYISYVSSTRVTQINSQNNKLIKAINNLEKIIKSNLIAGQYYLAIGTFQKHVFPFATSYDNDLALPNYAKLKLNENDFADLVMKKIKDLQSRNLTTTNTFNKYDKFIHNQAEFNSKYVQMSPFLVWPHEIIKESVSGLLEGKEVTLRADISKGLDKNVIKFNQIAIRFNMHNSTVQEGFDQLLNNFGITMVHHGDSHYKCGNNIYTMISDKKTIYYSFKTKDDGEPIDTNEVYDKIKNNHFILSPYATWNIKITNISNSFDMLKEFWNQDISIELEGHGQYVDKEIDICSNKLDHYYKIHESRSSLEDDFYTVESIRKKSLDEVSTNKLDVTRNRREVDATTHEEHPCVSSGATATARFLILNDILYSLGNGFVALKCLNPVNAINDWFANNDKQMDMQTVDTRSISSYVNEVNTKLQIQNSSMRNQTEYDLPDLQSNLLLLDLLVKKKNRNKNKGASDQFSSGNKNEYAQRLAYKAYIPNEQIISTNS